MFDFSHLLYDPRPRQKVEFFGNPSYNDEWQTWRKPAGAKFIFFYTIGGGGSGGCSSNNIANANNAGGAGGGSASYCSCFIPAMFVPDILYIQVAQGGIPVVASGQVGTAGGNTYISVDQQASPYGMYTAAFGGGGGGAGTTAISSIGGAGAVQTAAATPKYSVHMMKGMYNADSSLDNFTGSIGGAGSIGNGPALTSQIGLTGGAGGGGAGNNTTSGYDGGTLQWNTTTEVYGADSWSNNAGGTPGNPGNDGWIINGPGSPGYWLAFTGGTGGGGGNNTVNAANGGNGSWGCGGGGAGGTWSTHSLATPGRGGNGFAYVISIF